MEKQAFNLGMSADDLRAAVLRSLPMAELMARFTPTPKDDQAVAFVKSLFANDETWAAIKALAGLS